MRFHLKLHEILAKISTDAAAASLLPLAEGYPQALMLLPPEVAASFHLTDELALPSSFEGISGYVLACKGTSCCFHGIVLVCEAILNGEYAVPLRHGLL